MFQPKYIHFVYSYVVYIAFPSCLRGEDQFVVCFVLFFFPRRARGHVAVMVNGSFFESPISLVVENTYDQRSQIRFSDSSQKRTLLKFKRFMVVSPLLFKLHITHLYCF